VKKKIFPHILERTYKEKVIVWSRGGCLGNRRIRIRRRGGTLHRAVCKLRLRWKDERGVVDGHRRRVKKSSILSDIENLLRNRLHERWRKAVSGEEIS